MKQTGNKDNKIRLQKYLAQCGACSRRKAMEWIFQGQVAINGEINREPSTAVDPETDRVELNGRSLNLKKYEYLLLNKPAGIITSASDPHASRTVFDLLPAHLRHLQAVGRLDKNTEGLLFFTNDGELAHRLMHPKFEIDKRYFVRLKGALKSDDCKKMEKGIMLEGRKTSPAEIRRVQICGLKTECEIILHEGRKRQIRKMFSQLGYHVVFLKRIQQGSLALGSLPKGKWRPLSQAEITRLKTSLSR